MVILWSTTPLAIKWSAEGAGVIFSAMLRMAIGTVCVFCMLIISNTPLQWHKSALLTYLAISLQIFAAMMAVYWSSLFIPSGWVSVIFGLTPFMTALLAAWLLAEKSLTPGKIASYLLGISGLLLMFFSAMELNTHAIQGICGVLLASLLHSISAVWVKKIQAGINSLMQVAGGLLFSLPLYFISWYWQEDAWWPVDMPVVSLLSIVYLGVIATSFGFVLYYYILSHQPATRVALITIISPVMALWLGHFANGEIITIKVIAGTTLILSALILHQCVERWQKRRA